MTIEKLDRLRVLVSFHYFKKKNFDDIIEQLIVNNVPPDLFADSGAFSAWTQGAPVTVEEYAEWLHKWKHYFSVYCNLDVIDNPEETKINQRKLESLGLKPLPVWHIRTDRKVFEELCEEYKYVAVGGMVGTYWKKLMPKLVWAVKYGLEHGTVIHGLGLTALTPMMQLPLYSVDSSSWGSGYRYGSVPVWDFKKNKKVIVQLGDKKKWLKYSGSVKQLGFSAKRFANRDVGREEIASMSAISVMLQENYIRRNKGKVVLPEGDKPEIKETNGGLKMYLACGSVDEMTLGAEGLRSYLASSPALEPAHLAKHLREIT